MAGTKASSEIALQRSNEARNDLTKIKEDNSIACFIQKSQKWPFFCFRWTDKLPGLAHTRLAGCVHRLFAARFRIARLAYQNSHCSPFAWLPSLVLNAHLPPPFLTLIDDSSRKSAHFIPPLPFFFSTLEFENTVLLHHASPRSNSTTQPHILESTTGGAAFPIPHTKRHTPLHGSIGMSPCSRAQSVFRFAFFACASQRFLPLPREELEDGANINARPGGQMIAEL